MKKKRSVFLFTRRKTQKFWIMFRCVSFFMLLSILHVSGAAFSQGTISISQKNVSIRQVLDEIEKSSNYKFIYRNENIDVNKIIDVDVTNADIKTTLKAIFSDREVSYRLFENNVVAINLNSALQDKNISGKVTDTSVSPLPGVTVVLKGTTQGTITDDDGNYSLSSVPEDGILVFSFVGMKTQEIQVSGRMVVNVVMEEDAIGIEEVVAVGYGTQKKAGVTGSVASVNAKDLNFSASANFTEALQGKAAGVQVIQSTGQPGARVSLQLRSNPSNANAGVLYVVDGVPVNDNAGTPNSAKYGMSGVDQSPLNFINPNDIESINFLKDASAASIYGARAGAGVVLVTTKRGASGNPKLTYSANYGFQKADRVFDLLNTQQYMDQYNLVSQEVWMKNYGIAPYYGTNTASSPGVPAFTNPYSESDIAAALANNYPSAMTEIIRNGITNQHNISLTGGTEKTSYFISGNYFNQKGVLINSDLTRYNGKINFDQKLSGKVKVGVSLIVSNSTTDNVNTGGANENGGMVTAAIYFPANLPFQQEDGSYTLNAKYPAIPNPISYKTVTDFTKSYRVLTSAYAQWEIINGLTAKGNFSYDQSENKRNSYYPTTFLYGAQAGGLAAINVAQANTSLTEWTLNYKKNLMNNRLGLDLLGGYSYQLSNWNSVNAGNQKFVSDVISFYNLGAGQALTPSVGSSQSQQKWASYFFRANLIWNNKYILQGSMRADGASNFATNKKWGYFPSVSASWILSEEGFMKSVSVLNYLKLRAGYGETGNSSFGGSAFATYGLGVNPNFGVNQQFSGVYLTQAANPNLTWETAGELNAGLDFGFLKNRISGSADVFSKTIRNLITQIPLPADNITSFVWGNAGSTRSQGFEIGLQSRNMVEHEKGGFTWTTTLNLSKYLNYWIERSPQALATLPKYVTPTGRKALYNGVYGYEAAGLFKGNWGQQPSTMPGMLPGGIVIKDIHGYDTSGNLSDPDGKITSADQTSLFNWDPKLILGFGNQFTFKGLDLNIYFSGMIKKGIDSNSPNSIYRMTSVQDNLYSFGWNESASVVNRWSFQNPDNNRPTGLSDGTYSNFQNNSSYWVVDASFIRCKNISVGYTLPKELIYKLGNGISSVRISVDLENLFTITHYKGLDPEIDQSNFYPLNKSYMAGLSVIF